MRRLLTITLLLVVLLGTAQLKAKDQTFRIDKTLNFVSTNLKAAVCRDNGNILVVLNELKTADPSYGRIYSILLKRKADGTYAPAKIQMLSPNSGTHVRPSVAYLSQMGMFIVVWDNAGLTLSGGPTKIIGQLVKPKNGKPKKGNFDLVSDNAINLQPIVSNVREKPASAPGAIAEEEIKFMLMWTRYQTTGSAPAEDELYGLHGVPGFSLGKSRVKVDFKLEATIDPRVGHDQYQLSALATSGKFRWRENEDEDGFYLSFSTNGEKQIPDGSVWEYQGFKISGYVKFDVPGNNQSEFVRTKEYWMPEGSHAPDTLLTSPKGVMPALKTAVFISDVGCRKALFEDQKIKQVEDLDFGSTVIQPRTFRIGARITFRAPEANPSAKPVYGYVVAATQDGNVYHQRITDAGKDVKKRKKIFNHGGKLQSFDIWRIRLDDEDALAPKDNDTFILWQKQINNTKHEAWVYFTNMK